MELVIQPLKKEQSFDFPLIMYRRLTERFGEQAEIDRREFYRIVGLLFKLRKHESRLLLHEFRSRFGVEFDSKTIRFSAKMGDAHV